MVTMPKVRVTGGMIRCAPSLLLAQGFTCDAPYWIDCMQG